MAPAQAHLIPTSARMAASSLRRVRVDLIELRRRLRRYRGPRWVRFREHLQACIKGLETERGRCAEIVAGCLVELRAQGFTASNRPDVARLEDSLDLRHRRSQCAACICPTCARPLHGVRRARRRRYCGRRCRNADRRTLRRRRISFAPTSTRS